MKFILKYWSILAFIIVSIVSVISHAYLFGVYSANFKNRIDTQEIRLELVELKAQVNEQKITLLERDKAVSDEKYNSVIRLLDSQGQSLRRIEDILLAR